MPSTIQILFLLFIIYANYSFSAAATNRVENNETSHGKNQYSLVHIGVVLDLDSSMGSMADLCINMALSDFYSEHSNYRTRLQLHTKNAESLLDNIAVNDQGRAQPFFRMSSTFSQHRLGSLNSSSS
ncbi:glutamate receptor 2.2-like [Forsythia ovata]|uniref:Glutamate receptor 2.2-like n=1 Tax=Forsythia ovata TaxID=205694 RepID=A0ABD1SRK1_9LAMI